MTIQDAYTIWKQEKAGSLKPATYSTYVLIMDKHVMPRVGEKEKLGQQEAQQLMEDIEASGKSAKTAHDCMIALKNILRYAASKGLYPSPEWMVTGQAHRVLREVNLLSSAQQGKILEYLHGHNSPKDVGVYLAVTTGVTIGELCNLRWQDVDLKARVLHVRTIVNRHYHIDKDTNIRTWTLSADKDDNQHIIPLAPEQIDYLKPIVSRHRPELFLLSNGEAPVNPRTIRAYTASVFNALDIRGHQYKDLRHSFAVRCIETGCDFSTLASLLGTTDYDTLIHLYRPYAQENPRLAMEKMMAGIKI